MGRKNAFLTGAMILAAAGLICRALGVIFRIPLANIVGNFGMGLYQMVFPLYSLLLIVSSAGVPVAISKMVAREKVEGNYEQCKRILLNAIVLLGAIGAVVSALFMIFSHQIAHLQGNGDVGIVYLAIAPSVFLVCFIAAFRGYFQGLQNMVPTAVSQITEQVIKVAVGITLAAVLIKVSVVMAVFGAILAVTISEAAALVFLVVTYLAKHKKLKVDKAKLKIKGAVKFPLMWQILKASAPITLMAAVFPLILVFDSMVVINLLKAAGESGKAATQLYGIQSGAVHTLINLPAVLGVALATAIVPTVASLFKQNKTEELRTKCALTVKIIFLLAMFFVILYAVFSKPILDLLYHKAFSENREHFGIAANLLRIEAVMVLFMGLTSVFGAMLQGLDKAKFPLIALAAGGAVKIVFELSLIKTIGIYAVSIGNVLCFFVAAVINIIFALKYVKVKGALVKNLAKAAALVGGVSGGLFLLAKVMPDNRWWVLLSSAVAVLAYAGAVLLLRFFNKDEKRVFKKLKSEN